MHKARRFLLFFWIILLGICWQFLHLINEQHPTTIIDVPLISQYPNLPTGCESVAATMLLLYYEVDLSPTEFASNYLEKSNHFYEANGKLYGPNPSEVFVGNPFSEYSYGCYSEVIEEAINTNIKDIEATQLIGVSLDELSKNQLPCLIWATMGMKESYPGNEWYLENEKLFTWTAREHCLVLVGYDNNNYYLNDPQTGTVVKYKKRLVQQRYEELGSQAIVLKKSIP